VEMLATGTYTVMPRRKIGSCETAPAGAVVLELPVIKRHFDKPLSQAAIALGISVTAIKKVRKESIRDKYSPTAAALEPLTPSPPAAQACRKMGIRRWPHRMVKGKRLCSSSKKTLELLDCNLDAFDTNEKEAIVMEDEPDVQLKKSLPWTGEATGPLSPARACPDQEIESQKCVMNQEITAHLETIYQARRFNQRNQPKFCITECDDVESQFYRHAVTAGSSVGGYSDFGRASTSSSFSSSCETVVVGALSPTRDYESPCASPPCITVASTYLSHVHDGHNMRTGLSSVKDLHMSQWRVEDNLGLCTDQWRADLPTEIFASAQDPTACCPAVPKFCVTGWGLAAE
jgi:hypothetical protein